MNELWYIIAFLGFILIMLKTPFSYGWIHSIADEPQVGEGAVPLVPVATDANMTIVRMHGRNVQGWNKHEDVDWREVRFLYKYSTKELLEWKKIIQELSKHTKDIFVLFNNNLGGDAAGNAKAFQEMLGGEIRRTFPKTVGLILNRVMVLLIVVRS